MELPTLYGTEHPLEVTEAIEVMEEETATSDFDEATYCRLCGCAIEEHFDTCYDCGLQQRMEDMADARRKYDE